jgi:hypothetical protein
VKRLFQNVTGNPPNPYAGKFLALRFRRGDVLLEEFPWEHPRRFASGDASRLLLTWISRTPRALIATISNKPNDPAARVTW